ncbi:MAG TPA: SAM-dependent chlorinase/fluorinase [Terrimicrobiaceae bacterium]|nr:SAM-dependent chlorinase/fluorinase [Terrimicrobiaceae bacterium]
MIITLTTDFGYRDSFVGTMKGVILGISPEVRIVDLSHGVAAGDIRGGAFALMTATPHFPEGTIHVVVVDPGVGSTRRAIAIRTPQAIFLGPDNGVLSWAVRDEASPEVRMVSNQEFLLPRLSATFHGRDLFAPAAAWLAHGRTFADLGPEVATFERLRWPDCRSAAEGFNTEVIYVDIYGNCITAFSTELAAAVREVILPTGQRIPFLPFYSAAPPGSPLAVAGSSGFVEIAINRGNAAKELAIAPGASVTIIGADST